MFENYISNEDKRLLNLFNKYDDIVNWITKEIKYSNESCGVIRSTISKEDFSVITEEMEKYFKGREEFNIETDWNLNCELFEVDWNC